MQKGNTRQLKLIIPLICHTISNIWRYLSFAIILVDVITSSELILLGEPDNNRVHDSEVDLKISMLLGLRGLVTSRRLLIV